MITGSTSLDDSFGFRSRCRMCDKSDFVNDNYLCKTCWICNSQNPGAITLSLDLNQSPEFLALEKGVHEQWMTYLDVNHRIVGLEKRLQKLENTA